MRGGREEQRVRVEFWERGVWERKAKMIKKKYQRNKVMCIPPSLTFKIEDMLSSAKSSRGTQKDRDEKEK